MIPFKLYTISHQNNQLVKQCIDSWKDFDLTIFTEKDITEFIRVDFNKYYDKYVSSVNTGYKADIARWLLLYHYGGYWIDEDLELKDKDKFIDFHNNNNGHLILGYRKRFAYIEFISSFKHNKKILNIIDQIDPYKKGDNIIETSGPVKVASINNEIKLDLKEIDVKDIYYYDLSETKSSNKKEVKDNAFLIHHWNGSWTKNKV